MAEDKVTLTEYRPHTAVIITIGFNSMTLFVEEPIDQIKTVLERIKNQEYFTLNVAMQKHRNYILWDPECDDDITYCDWDLKKATVKAFHKLYKKQGTGGILITRWWSDCLEDPIHLSKVDKKALDQNPGISFFTYDPRNYWYQVEEMSDRAIPFLIFNMAIRGMNGVAVQCNSLSREAKEAYFIRNDSDNFLGFSKVIKLPHTKDLGQELHINKWVTQFSKG